MDFKPAKDKIEVRVADWLQDQPHIYQIRHQVFQLEQGIAPALEFDGRDEAAIHFLVCQNGVPVGTVRVRWLTSEIAKVERLAVLMESRGAGIGKRLMETTLHYLARQQALEVVLHAQAYLQDFYQSLGFEPIGSVFEEAGIPHVKMRKRLQ